MKRRGFLGLLGAAPAVAASPIATSHSEQILPLLAVLGLQGQTRINSITLHFAAGEPVRASIRRYVDVDELEELTKLLDRQPERFV